MKDIFLNIEQQIENIDAKIEGIVKNATDSKNYEKLNERINDMVNCSTNAFEKGYARAEAVVKAQAEKFKSASEMQQENLKTQAERESQTVHTRQEAKKPVRNDLFAKKDGGGGLALAIIGFVLAAPAGIAMLVMLFLNAFLGMELFMVIKRFLLMPGFVIFLIMGITGVISIGRINRFKKYIQLLDGKMYADVSYLAKSVGKSDAFTRNDLRRMISKHWFKQGFLTHDQETLIVSKDTYSEYQANQQQILDAQTYQDQIRQMHEQLPEHARKTIQLGEDLIKEIHQKKVDISDYDMTIKLSHLESILKKIFKRVEKQPEVVPQMRKMMDYYLPTTIKLLSAYVQLDKQAVAGANILSAKAEIEESLDTLISAYEKLLDDLFEDTMLDVSTDISVLNTMLAQDGLTNNGDFKNMREANKTVETLTKEESNDE